MSEAIRALQSALGVKADGIRGPVTNAAILRAADQGRLTVKEAPKAVFITPAPSTEARGDIPSAGMTKMHGVNPVLQAIIVDASIECNVPFTVIEGLRTIERQRILVAQGASKTMNSRHLTGHAVDLWPLDPATERPLPAGTPAAEARLWADLRAISAVVKRVAAERNVAIEWGGDWGWDAPHFQLPRAAFP